MTQCRDINGAMKHVIRQLVTVALLVFVVSVLATHTLRSFRSHGAAEIPDGKSLLFFHAQARCSTCLRLEKIIRELLDDYGENITFVPTALVSIAYDAPENRDIADFFHVGTISVILVEKKADRIIRQRDLSHNVWEHVRDDAAMTEMLTREVREFGGQ